MSHKHCINIGKWVIFVDYSVILAMKQLTLASAVIMGLTLVGCGGSGNDTGSRDNSLIYHVNNSSGIDRQVFPFTAVSNMFTSVNVQHMRVSPDGTKLLYSSAGVLTSANIDGTNVQTYTGYKLGDWNEDGTRIYAVTSTGNKIRVMDADGTNVSADIYDANFGTGITSIDVNPDDTKIAFTAAFVASSRIHTINIDGSSDVEISSNGSDAANVRWNASGDVLAFEKNGDIWTINADGTNEVGIATTGATETQASFRTDGSLLYISNGDIWSMTANGGAQIELYNGTNPLSWPVSHE